MIEYVNIFNFVIKTSAKKTDAQNKMELLFPEYEQANFLLKHNIDNHLKE